MSRFAILKQIMLQHRYRLVLTYILFSIEMLGNLLRPFFLGVAINDLIKGTYQGLIILSAVHLGWLLIGIIRHRLDTRTYSAIYSSLVTRFLSRRYHKTDVSKLSAHSTLAREFVDFLEFDLVYVLEALFSILGSLLLLFLYDTSVVVVCLGILLPVILFSWLYGKRMQLLNRQKNDELEKQVDIISTGNTHLIKQHYDNLRKWQIRISDQEAWNFGIMEFLVMLVIGLSLLITNKAAGSGMEAGSLIGIYSYIQRFVSGLDTIPYTVQRVSSLSDITRRIELQETDLENEGLKEVA
ncbi:MAG TPA: ABC transporter six-transmembrane domain-containing protein [Chitinophagaceae bacterium]|jgi:ABC-type multidrug transport system fused ATPase/permease subunit|nr:ABC transporter six-transmembrane domain-containing protein [Chitinophagaceae bacterium]